MILYAALFVASLVLSAVGLLIPAVFLAVLAFAHAHKQSVFAALVPIQPIQFR